MQDVLSIVHFQIAVLNTLYDCLETVSVKTVYPLGKKAVWREAYEKETCTWIGIEMSERWVPEALRDV